MKGENLQQLYIQLNNRQEILKIDKEIIETFESNIKQLKKLNIKKGDYISIFPKDKNDKNLAVIGTFNSVGQEYKKNVFLDIPSIYLSGQALITKIDKPTVKRFDIYGNISSDYSLLQDIQIYSGAKKFNDTLKKFGLTRKDYDKAIKNNF